MRSSFRYLPRVFPYLRPYKWALGGSALLTLASVIVGLAQPWPLAFLVDSVLENEKEPPGFVTDLFGFGPTRLILVAVTAGLLLTLITHTLDIINEYLQTRMDQRMVLDFRSDLFAHVQRLSLAFHDDQRKGTLMFAINYQASAVGSITVSLLPLVQAVLTVAGMLYISYRFHPVLALLALTVVPFIYASTGFYGKRIEPRLRDVRGREARSLSIIHEAISMLRVIVAFGRERYEHRRFREQGEGAVDARVQVTMRQTAFALGVNLITAVGTALVVGFGANLVLDRQLSVGELLVVLSYIASVYRPLEEISGSLAGMQEQLISLEAAVGLLDTEAEVADPPNGVRLGRAEGRIAFEDVSFDYKGRVNTLRGITFSTEPGQLVGIVGATGAGKSTLVSLLPRFMDPDQGRVLLDGHDLREISLESLRDQISVVLQEPLLFSGTIKDNIRYGRLDASDAEIEAAAEAANAHSFISRLPKGYDTVLGEGGAKLSGGERQRISVARAFLKDAPILILDEPTSSIDSKTESVILDAIGRLMAGRTTMMIAHRLSTIRAADQILVLDHGEIVEQGTHDELFGIEDGAYRAMCLAQGMTPAGIERVPVPAAVPEHWQQRREARAAKRAATLPPGPVSAAPAPAAAPTTAAPPAPVPVTPAETFDRPAATVPARATASAVPMLPPPDREARRRLLRAVLGFAFRQVWR